MNKLFLGLFLVSILLLVPNVSALPGSGTEADPYNISTCQEFFNMTDAPSGYYQLTNNVDCSGIDGQSWPVFLTVTDGVQSFNLDGNGYNISNFVLTMNATGGAPPPLIDTGVISMLGSTSGYVRNMNFINPIINQTSDSAVGICAAVLLGVHGSGGGDVENITITGLQAEAFSESISGVICQARGTNYDNIQVLDANILNKNASSFTGAVFNQLREGSFGNRTFNKIAFTGIYNTTNTDSSQYSCGISCNQDTSISATYTITNSYVNATLVGYDVAGLFSYDKENSLDTDNFLINDSYFAGDIIATNSADTILFNVSGGHVCNEVFYDNETTTVNSACGTEKSTTEMQSFSTFSNWDFANVWDIDEGTSYPYFGTAAAPMSGSGTIGDPYIITTCSHFPNMRDDDSAYYTLGNDIDCTGFDSQWPIFTYQTDGSKSWNFDGSNYTISNIGFEVNVTSGFPAFLDTGIISMFGRTTGSITNVNAYNVTITQVADDDAYAPLVSTFGIATGGFENVTVDTFTANLNYAGCAPAIGGGAPSTNVHATNVNVNVLNTSTICGGLFGRIGGDGDVYDKVSLTNATLNYTSLSGSESEVSINGISGLTAVANNIVINNSYVQADIYIDGDIAAGLISTSTIEAFAGALTIEDSYFAGTINGATSQAPIQYNVTGITLSCTEVFYDSDLESSSDICGVGKTTTEMKDPNTFANWDLNNTWDIQEGVTYPYFGNSITENLTPPNSAPTIDTFNPTNLTLEITIPETQDFNITASDANNDSLSYEWYINGTPQSNNLTIFTINSQTQGVGAYNITVVVNDSELTDSQEWTLTINPNNAPIIDTFNPTNVTPSITDIQSQGFNITASDNESDPLSYEWYINGTPQSNNATNFTVDGSVQGIGVYNVTVLVNDTFGIDTQEWILTIIDNSAPTIDTFNPTNTTPEIFVNQTQDFNITASDANNDSLSYEWYINGTPQSNDLTTFTLNGTEQGVGTYNITVIVNDSELTNSQEWTLTVNELPNVAPSIDEFTPSSSTPEITIPDSQYFEVNASDVDLDTLSYEWYVNGVSYGNDSNFTYDSTVIFGGGYKNVTVIVSDGEDIDTQFWNLTVYTQTTQNTVLQENLTFYYTFDGDFTDSLGNYDATAGGSTQSSIVKLGSGAMGDSYSVNTGYQPTILASDSFSVNFWYDGFTFNDFKLGGSPALGMTNFQAQQILWIDDTGASSFSQNPGISNTAGWQMITLVRNADTDRVLVYVDGSLTQNYTDTITGTMTLPSPYNLNFDSSIYVLDEFAYYERALSGDDVTDLYNTGTGVQYPFATNSFDPLAPNITSYNPTNLTPSILENQTQSFNITAVDYDSQSLSYEWYINGTPQSNNATSFIANGTSLGAGTYNITVVVNDSELTNSQEWVLSVFSGIPSCSDTISGECNLPVGSSYTYNDTNIAVEFNSIFNGETINESDIIAGSNSIFVNSGSALNVPASITYYNVDTPSNKIIYRDGLLCTTQCQNLSFTIDSLSVDVTGWSNYSYENNTAPTIDSYNPTNLTPQITDVQTQEFNISASDINNQTLSYEWYINGTPQSNNLSSFTIDGSVQGIGTYNITAEVTDGNLSDTQEWTLTVISSYVSLNPPYTDNMILYYNFSTKGPVPDLVNGYDGIHPILAGPQFSDGIIGNGFIFDGSNDYVSTGYAPNYAVSDDFSYSIWFNTTSSDGALFSADMETGIVDTEIFFQISSGNVQFRLSDDNNVVTTATSTSTFNDGQWHHAVAVRDATNDRVIVYVDGVVEANVSDSSTGTLNMNTADFNLGASYYSGGSRSNYYTGLIDEFGVWEGKALTIEEVQWIYNSGIGLSYPFEYVSPYTENLYDAYNSSGSSSNTAQFGYRINTSFTGVSVEGIKLIDGVGCTRVLVVDGNSPYSTVYATGNTSISNYLYLDSSYELTPGTLYGVVCDANGASYNWNFDNSATYPDDDNTHITFVSGLEKAGIPTAPSDAAYNFDAIMTTIALNSAPTIDTYNPTNLTPIIYDVQNQTFNITASDVNNDSLSYEWYVNGSAQSNNNTEFTAVGLTLGFGTFNITAEVTDGVLIDTQEWTLTIVDNTAPTIDSFTPTNTTPSISQINSQEFTIIASDTYNDVLSYEWYINGTPQSVNDDNITISGSLGIGSYNITAEVTDGELSDTQEWTLSITPNTAPFFSNPNPGSYVATIGETGIVELQIDANDNDGDTMTAYWYKNGVLYDTQSSLTTGQPTSVSGDATDNGDFPAGKYGQDGFYNMTVILTDGIENVSAQFNVTISPQNLIGSFTPTNLTPSVTVGNNQTFTVTYSDQNGDPTPTYAWFINGSNQGVNSDTFTINSTTIGGVGTYNITATITDFWPVTDEETWILTVEPDVNAPTIDNFSPADTTPQIYDTQSQDFSINASDLDSDPLSYEWYINGTPQSNNATNFTIDGSVQGIGSYNVTVIVTDGLFNTSQEWELSIIAEPEFAPSIDSFTPVSTTPSIFTTQNQEFTITVSDANTNETLSYEWYVNGTPQSENNTDFTAQGSILGAGTYNITAIVTDSALLTDSQEWTLTISLQPPIISSVTISPATLLEQSSPIGSCTATGITNLDYTYYWYRDGVVVVNETQTNLTSGTEVTNQYGLPLNVGEEWVFSCYVEDQNGLSAGFTNSSTKIVQPNSAPSVTPTIDTPVYDVSDTLNARCLINDVDGDNSTVDWKLYKNDVVQIQDTELNVAPGTNLLLATITEEQLFIGDEWIISCNATDGINSSGFVNSSTATILEDARPPVISSVTLGPEIVLENYTNLTSSGIATDPNGGTINFTFTLYNNDVQVEQQNTSITSGGTANINWAYNSFVNGDELYVNLYAFDDTGRNDTENSSLRTVTNENQAPVIATIRTNPASFIDNDDNIQGYCKATDAEGNSVSYNYIWYVNDVVVKSGTKTGTYTQNVEVLVDTLSASASDEGETVIFSCNAEDLINASAYANSTTQLIYEVGNEAPIIRSLNIVPTGTQDTTVNFNVTINATDADADNVRYEWRFVKNGIFQSTTTTSYFTQGVSQLLGVLSNSSTSANDVWYVRARAYDGTVYSGWSVSNSITIQNTLPIMQSANIPTTPLENTSLESLCTASDADGDSVTFQYRWYKDDVLTLTTEDVVSTETTADEEWILSCRAYDGKGYSDWLNSTGVTIIDTVTAPTMSSVTISGLNDDSEFIGTCVANDIEGDLINYTYEFFKNGVSYTTGSINGQTQGVAQTVNIAPTITTGDVWKFSCDATDLDGSTGSVNSTALTVPSIIFSYNVESATDTTILVNFNTNADSVKVYRDGVLRTQTTLSSYLAEGLVPETQYEFELVPVKDSFTSTGTLFNVTTSSTDNNAPTMTSTTILPGTLYTNSTVTGRCLANDIDSIKLFYTYEWKVNNATVSSGVTSLYDRNTQVSVGGLSNSLFESGDNVTLGCSANDGIFGTAQLTTTKQVQNLIPTVEDVLIEVNETIYQPAYTYFDGDGDTINSVSFEWFKNDVSVSNNETYLISETDINDVIYFTVTITNDYHTISVNSSEFLVGDFTPPTLTILTYPTESVFTDSAALLEAKCEDEQSGVAIGYPKVTFLNPSNELEEVRLFFIGDDIYTRYNLFDEVGTYTEITFSCIDGNSNLQQIQLNDTIVALDRETTVNVGGGGSAGGSGGDEPIVSFEVIPEIETVVLRPGSTSLEEFEVRNTGEVDIRFTSAVLRTEDFETFNWISFDDGSKTAIFDINLVGGLSGDNRFVRYQVSVPEGTPEGTYIGLIEVNGREITEQLQVEIIVDEGAFVTLTDFLNIPLFTIPGTGTPTGNVVAGEAEIQGQTVFTVGGLILVIIGILIFASGYVYLRRRVR